VKFNQKLKFELKKQTKTRKFNKKGSVLKCTLRGRLSILKMAKKKAAQWLNTRLIILRIEGLNLAAEKPGKRK
jgi:hypothetical protein